MQGQAAGAAVRGDTYPAGAAKSGGAGGQPSGVSAAGAGRCGGVSGGGTAVPVLQRKRIAVRLLRVRPRSGPVPGRGVRRHLSGRGHAAEGAVDAADRRLRPRGQRLPQAHLLYVQSGRAGARVHQAAVHRQAVRGRRAAGGLRLYSGAGHGQHGAAGAAAGLSQDAGGPALQTEAGMAGGTVGRVRGAGVSGVHR